MKRYLYLSVLAAIGLLTPPSALAEEAPAATPVPEAKDMLVTPAPQERQVEGLPAPSAPAEEGGQTPDGPPPETGAAKGADEDGVVPAPFPLSRYARLWEHSPFHLESVAPPVESVGLTQQYALTGIASVSGEPIAFVLERATQTRQMLKKESNAAGLSLVQVDVQAKYADSTATIRRGGEVGVVKFDATAAGGGLPAAPPGQMPQAAAPPMPGQPPNVPMSPGLVPGVPGPGVSPDGQVINVPGSGNIPPPRVIRRRAVIPSAP